MAQIVDNPLLCSTPLKPFVGLSQIRLPPGRLSARNTPRRTTKKEFLVYSIQGDVGTKESLERQTRSQNGPSIQRSSTGGLEEGRPISLEAKVTIRRKRRPKRDEKMMDRMDSIADRLGEKVTLQLVSMDVDPVTCLGKRSQISFIKDWVTNASVVADKVQYTADFAVKKSFGIPGAIIVSNNHQNEFFLESISLHGYPQGIVHFPTYSWVHSENNNPTPRVFFSNQVYLPFSTPKGLQDLREKDLEEYRGDGEGVRQPWENIYDYDVYNDLSDVDKDKNQARPILGGSKEYQYPRRNRTGRPPAKTDPSRESRVEGTGMPYVPRDETFEPIKQDAYFSAYIRGLVQQKVPNIREQLLGTRQEEFESFDEIDQLYCDGLMVKKKKDEVQSALETFRDLPVFQLLPELLQGVITAASGAPTYILRYPQPQLQKWDRFAWIRDVEFGRQTLAGVNPCAIECLKVFPPVSALDDVDLYGPRESAFEEKHILPVMDGLSVEEAIEQKKLFILDYHDTYLPYINRINDLKGMQGYASRTILFLTREGTLMPIAIELSLPEPNLSREVFVPGRGSTEAWLWKMAKAHVSCNDAGYHQLISHWLKTHASVEPYSIAANRQLSPLHPIFKLLHPHFRYTLEINAAARQSLISADGVIERSFLPGRYAMEMSSAVYGAKWRFDKEGLPQELISRGMAEEDQTSPTGVKLLIEDYPFANDGLLVWAEIEKWVTDYTSIYYKTSRSIQEDTELQNWWEEVRTRGHADKKDEDWWPSLETKEDLIRILCTMLWITSGLHAAVNFGQYDYIGYMPNKPTLMRKHIPQPDTPEYKMFIGNSQRFFLSSLPSQMTTTVLMAVIESLSTHSPDEEYLGSDTHPNWFGCHEANKSYKRFQQRMVAVEEEIRSRNANPELRNRNGAGILPYELLVPWSEPGVSGRGIPNSISI